MNRQKTIAGRAAPLRLVGGAWLALLAGGDASAAPGDHIRAGVVEIVPSAGLGLAYHSNVYRAEQGSAGAGSLNVQPGLQIKASGSDHEFQFDGDWSLRKFLFVGGDEADRAERLGNLDRFDTFTVAGSANLFKQGAVGLKLGEEAARRNWVVDALAAEAPYLSMFRNAVNAGLRTNPGSALEVTPSFVWTYDSFQAPQFGENQESRALNKRNSVGGMVDAKWAFLPRTAFVANLDYVNNSWAINVVEAQLNGPQASDLPIPNSSFVKATAGIDGRFTQRLSARGVIGFGTGFFSEQSVATSVAPVLAGVSAGDGLLAQVGVKYALVPASETGDGAALALGYSKDFRSSFFTDYVSFNQLSAELSGSFSSVRPAVRYEGRFEGYRGTLARQDLVNTVRGTLSWVPREFFQIEGGAAVLSRSSSEQSARFNDVQLTLRTMVQY